MTDTGRDPMMHSATKWEWNDRDLKYDEVPDPDAEPMSCKEEEKPDIAVRLIDANALRGALGNAAPAGQDDGIWYGLDVAIRVLDAAPTVSCGECANWEEQGYAIGAFDCDIEACGEGFIGPDFGCSRFERRP